jgi:hypothetical protein
VVDPDTVAGDFEGQHILQEGELDGDRAGLDVTDGVGH